MPTIITYYIQYQNLIGLKILISNAVGLQIRPNAQTCYLRKNAKAFAKRAKKKCGLKDWS